MNRKQGFTLVEIMIVVLIIGLLAAIAVPNFAKARKKAQRNACIDNLSQIEGAFEQMKMEGAASTDFTSANLYGADKYIKVAPTCPSTKDPYDLEECYKKGRPVCPNPKINGEKEDELHKLSNDGTETAGG